MQFSGYLFLLAFAAAHAGASLALAQSADRTADVPTETTIVTEAKPNATGLEIGPDGMTTLPWRVVETKRGRGPTLRTARPFLTLANAITWDPKSQRHVAEFLFGLDSEDGQTAPLAQAMDIRFSVTCEDVTPNVVRTETIGPLGYDLVKVSCSRQVKNEREHQFIELFAGAGIVRYTFQIPRRPGPLTLVASSERMIGFGFDTVLLIASQLEEDGSPLVRSEDRTLRLVATSGTFDVQTITIPKKLAEASTTIRPTGVGVLELRLVDGERESPSVRIELAWPFQAILAALSGGALGGFVTSISTSGSRRRRSVIRRVGEGAALGALISITVLAVPSLLSGPIQLLGTELACFVIAAVAGVAGVPLIERAASTVFPAFEDSSTSRSSLGEGEAEELQRELEQRAKEGFERNRKRGLRALSLSTSAVPFFGDLEWRIEPHVNVLLGRNGYGKSHLLRLVAAMLAREGRALDEFFGPDGEQALHLQLSAPAEPGAELVIERAKDRWHDDVSKVPVLAISDTRFIDRSRELIERPDLREDESLPQGGALHFIRQSPNSDLMQSNLFRLCLDFLEHDKGAPVLRVLDKVIARLADSQFEIVDVRRRNPAETRFQIMVRTEGSPGPVRLQVASQGTLSVLAIVLDIYYFLAALYPERASSPDLCNQSAIVIIDEVDAHLHPAWQQKIVWQLRRTFPNVQFIMTAHSPLVVAGCRAGEVATLRRNVGTHKIELQRFEHDFIGWDPSEILRTVQEVEPADVEYLRLRLAATKKGDLASERAVLLEAFVMNESDKARLETIESELARIAVAEKKASERMAHNEMQGKVMALELQIRQLESALRRSVAPPTGPAPSEGDSRSTDRDGSV
jgi:hypothetical protein